MITYTLTLAAGLLAMNLNLYATDAPVASSAKTDWPGYLGPNGNNGVACDAAMVRKWADARLVWRSDVEIPDGQGHNIRTGQHWSPMGGNFGSPIVVSGKVKEAPAVLEGHFGYYPRVMGTRVVCGGGDTDQLHLYDATPGSFRLLDDASIPNAWGYEKGMLPACADGRLYFRTHDRLVCVDLRVDARDGERLGDVKWGGAAAPRTAPKTKGAPNPGDDGAEDIPTLE